MTVLPDPKTFVPDEILTAADMNARFSGLRGTVTFTSSGSFSKADYPWVKAVRVRLVGGGGGGGGAAATSAGQGAAGGGGGGAGYAEKLIAVDDLGASESVTVGAGGSGGTAGSNAGGNGGTSSFGAHLSGEGGSGGSGGVARAAPDTGNAGGDGGSGSDGDLNIRGARALPAWLFVGNMCGSAGGASHMGPEQRHGVTSTGVNGGTGRVYGGGGSGGFNTTDQAARSGGVGGAGVVIVELYG